jgi:hypothetical protein
MIFLRMVLSLDAQQKGTRAVMYVVFKHACKGHQLCIKTCINSIGDFSRRITPVGQTLSISPLTSVVYPLLASPVRTLLDFPRCVRRGLIAVIPRDQKGTSCMSLGLSAFPLYWKVQFPIPFD